jgi:hypothetical protein
LQERVAICRDSRNEARVSAERFEDTAERASANRNLAFIIRISNNEVASKASKIILYNSALSRPIKGSPT